MFDFHTPKLSGNPITVVSPLAAVDGLKTISTLISVYWFVEIFAGVTTCFVAIKRHSADTAGLFLNPSSQDKEYS